MNLRTIAPGLLLVGLFTLLLSATSRGQEAIGSTTSVKPQAEANTRTLAGGSTVYSKELIQTGDAGVADLRFHDNSNLFETWKKQFAGEAQARVVSASTIAALMATTYSTATIAGQSKPWAIQSRAFVRSLPFIEGTVRVLPGAAKQRPNQAAPLAHTTRALWRDRAERRSHGAAE
jgi:hypothetical protein